MIDDKKYIELSHLNFDELSEDELQSIKEYNKQLIEKYPFLYPRNVWTDEIDPDYDYTYTWLDDMPDGWRLAFGLDLVDEIYQELVKYDFVDKYEIVQIKEKWGGLRWYDNGVPHDSKVYDIIRKYEEISFKTCIKCGKTATRISTGWISPFCDNCIEEKYSRPITKGDIPEYKIIVK